MNPKLRLLLVGLVAICEVVALFIVVPTVILAMAAYGLLVCARSASAHARSISSLTRGSPPGSYDPAGGSAGAGALRLEQLR